MSWYVFYPLPTTPRLGARRQPQRLDRPDHPLAGDAFLQGVSRESRETATRPTSGCSTSADAGGHVSARYDPYVGGIETHVREVAGRLVERGIDLTVLTTHRGERLLNIAGLHDRAPPHRGQAETCTVTLLVRSLVNGLRRGPRARHQHALPFLALPAATAWASLGRHLAHRRHSSRVRTLGRVPQWRALGPSLRRCARVIGSASSRSRPRGHAGSTLALQRDPQRCRTLPSPQRPAARRAPLGALRGRLDAKGPPEGIAAMPEMLRRAPGARLGIVGSGPHEQALRRQVAEAGLGRAVSSPPSARRARRARHAVGTRDS